MSTWLYFHSNICIIKGKIKNLDPFYISTPSDIHGVLPNPSISKIGQKHITKNIQVVHWDCLEHNNLNQFEICIYQSNLLETGGEKTWRCQKRSDLSGEAPIWSSNAKSFPESGTWVFPNQVSKSVIKGTHTDTPNLYNQHPARQRRIKAFKSLGIPIKIDTMFEK
jgi:hypothetical protein